MSDEQKQDHALDVARAFKNKTAGPADGSTNGDVLVTLYDMFAAQSAELARLRGVERALRQIIESRKARLIPRHRLEAIAALASLPAPAAKPCDHASECYHKPHCDSGSFDQPAAKPEPCCIRNGKHHPPPFCEGHGPCQYAWDSLKSCEDCDTEHDGDKWKVNHTKKSPCAESPAKPDPMLLGLYEFMRENRKAGKPSLPKRLHDLIVKHGEAGKVPANAPAAKPCCLCPDKHYPECPRAAKTEPCEDCENEKNLLGKSPGLISEPAKPEPCDCRKQGSCSDQCATCDGTRACPCARPTAEAVREALVLALDLVRDLGRTVVSQTLGESGSIQIVDARKLAARIIQAESRLSLALDAAEKPATRKEDRL